MITPKKEMEERVINVISHKDERRGETEKESKEREKETISKKLELLQQEQKNPCDKGISKKNEECKIQNTENEFKQEEKGYLASKDSWKKLKERVYEVKNKIIITQNDFKNARELSPFPLKKESMTNRMEDALDLRNHLIYIKPNTLEGSQGQLCTRINGRYFVGSGTLCCLQQSSLRFVISCAHNFILKSLYPNEEPYLAESASYHFCKVNEKNYLKDSVINVFDAYPGYTNSPELLDGCDFAIGFLEEDFSFALMPDNTYLSYAEKEELKVGDIIRVVGYPGEKNGGLYEMEGKIQGTIKTGSNLVITYDIDSTEGQSGSAVYLKRGDKWVLIGVHIGYLEDHNVCVATGITAEIYNWIEDKATKKSDPRPPSKVRAEMESYYREIWPKVGVLSSKRLLKEFLYLIANPPDGVVRIISDKPWIYWHVLISGTRGSPYEGGIFNVIVEFPDNYPFKPPRIKFITKIYHQNIPAGEICCCLTNSWTENWFPVKSIIEIISGFPLLVFNIHPDCKRVPEIAHEFTVAREKFNQKAKKNTLILSANDEYIVNQSNK